MSNISKSQNPLRVVLNRIGEPTLAHYGAARTPINSPETTFGFWNDVITAKPAFEPDKEHLVAVLFM